MSVGVQGVQAGFQRASEAATSIVRAGLESGDNLGDLAASIVELKASEQIVKASAAVIRTADETLGTLVDTRA
jgi:hypothetical protein